MKIILINGGLHDRWCWDHVLTPLRAGLSVHELTEHIRGIALLDQRDRAASASVNGQGGADGR